ALTTTSHGKKVAKLSLGVKEYNPSGEDATMWINVELWNGLSERAMQVITKGREIVVAGRLVVQHYTKQFGDAELTMTKAFIRASNFHLCGPKPQSPEVASASTPIDAPVADESHDLADSSSSDS